MSKASQERRRRLVKLKEHLTKALPFDHALELMRFQFETGLTKKKAEEYFQLVMDLNEWKHSQDPKTFEWTVK